jgi:hypothetical protein
MVQITIYRFPGVFGAYGRRITRPVGKIGICIRRESI